MAQIGFILHLHPSRVGPAAAKMTIWLLVKNQVEEQTGLQTHAEAKPSAWMKQQCKVVAVGCSFERGRGSTSPRLLLVCFGLRYFSSLTEDT